MTEGLAASEEPRSLELASGPVLPLTDIRLVAKKSHCPEGYELIDRSIGGRVVHLGAPSAFHGLLGVNCRYICVSRDMKFAQVGCMLITSILVIKDSSPVPEQHRVVLKTSDSGERALLKGRLCVRHEGRHLCRRVVYDLCLVVTSQGERVPLGYQICGEVSNVTLAARLSHYQSPVPELPPLPPKSHKESPSQEDNKGREEHDSRLAAEKEIKSSPRTEAERSPRRPDQRPLAAVRSEGREFGNDSPTLDDVPVSKQFENVLRLVSQPSASEEGGARIEKREPKFLSLTQPEPLESLPVKEKLYSHQSGRTAENLPFALVGHYGLHRLLIEVDQLQHIPVVDVDETYRYSFKVELSARKGRAHHKSKHHHKHRSSEHSRRKRPPHHEDEKRLYR